MITLEVVGLPAPQGSKSAIVNPKTGKAVLVEGRSGNQRVRHKSWREGVAQAARDWLRDNPQPPIDEPLMVTMVFRFPLPKSDPFRLYHTGRPDVSKLARSTEDALVQGGLLKDDSLIFDLRAAKLYARQEQTVGATIVITPYGEEAVRIRNQLKEDAREARKRAKENPR